MGQRRTVGIVRQQAVPRPGRVDVVHDVHGFDVEPPVMHERRHDQVRVNGGIGVGQMVLLDQRDVPACPGAVLGDERVRRVRLPGDVPASRQALFRQREADALGAGRAFEMEQMQALELGHERALGMVDSGHGRLSRSGFFVSFRIKFGESINLCE